MVMPLPIPLHDSIGLVDEIVDERSSGINAAYFEGIRQEWSERVAEYLQHQGSPEHIPRWNAIPADRKTSFLNLYLAPNEDSTQGKMLADLRDHKLTICPACGELGRPNTLDHYLPKGKYPHFCVTPVNLFPMCDACQRSKLDKTGTADEPRFFLHPYFDVFIAEQVISVEIQPPYSSPTFAMILSDQLTAGQCAVMASHIRELLIEQRFAHYFKAEYLRTLKLVQMLRESGLPVVETLHAFEAHSRLPALNSWEHVYWSAVTGNAGMLDFLENGELPDFF
ncbi:MAG: hypothetical protein RL651_882 [Pseudomonadota bacterium]|jgi:hypothetical protein